MALLSDERSVVVRAKEGFIYMQRIDADGNLNCAHCNQRCRYPCKRQYRWRRRQLECNVAAARWPVVVANKAQVVANCL